MTLKAPFPWFGGKSRVADLVWDRFGDLDNYVEPFAGSLAVLLGRPTPAQTETVNDLDCVAPETRMLTADLTWMQAGEVKVGDQLIGFDENNGEAREGLRAPKKYRRLAKATVTGVRRLRKPCYRLTFDDGTTVVSSADHLWLGGSHKSGGRGWRWVKTANMVCNRKTQRSWVLKVAEVVDREETWEAGWLGGLFDGEGHIHAGPGLRLVLSQNKGPVLDRAETLLNDRGVECEPNGKRRCKQIQINGGIVTTLSLLMRFRPQRLINRLIERLGHISLYGRQHRAIGLVSKEFLGEQEVVAIETDCHTFIAEGLASHNCYLANFWRALSADPESVAEHADWPVNEADLHARHLWLVNQEEFRERMKTDPDYFDVKVAGWWVWGLSQWIGSGWCTRPDWSGRTNAARAARGIFRKIPSLGDGGRGVAAASLHRKRPMVHAGHTGKGVHAENPGVPSRFGSGNSGMGVNRQLPHLGNSGMGVNRQLPHLGDAGRGGEPAASAPGRCGDYKVSEKRPELGGRGTGKGIHADAAHSALYEYFYALAARLRRVRVCCGDWKRVTGPSVTIKHGVAGVFLDPPYDMRVVSDASSGRDGAAPSDGLYAHHDNDLSREVREWAIENGANPLLRIAVCGYEGEHQFPSTWDCVPWKAHGGYGAQRGGRGNENAGRERIWFSQHCLNPQENLFSQQAAIRASTEDAPLWLTALGDADLDAEMYIRGEK